MAETILAESRSLTEGIHRVRTSGLLCRVARRQPDVSEEHTAFAAFSYSVHSSNLNMEAICPSEMSDSFRTTTALQARRPYLKKKSSLRNVAFQNSQGEKSRRETILVYSDRGFLSVQVNRMCDAAWCSGLWTDCLACDNKWTGTNICLSVSPSEGFHAARPVPSHVLLTQRGKHAISDSPLNSERHLYCSHACVTLK
jgi:hypothetical protein